MSIGSFFLSRFYHLPPKRNEVARKRSIALPMADEIALATDIYAPKPPGPHPTILMRLPYGRNGFSAVAEAYAERGFNVVLQACRGTEQSGGEFDPLVNERADGLTTLRWIEAQPWFDGRLGLSGPSYLGYAQWAICDALPEHAAMATKVTSSEFQSVVFPAGAFHLGLWLGWMQVIEGLKGNPLRMSGMMFSGQVEKISQRAAMTLPLIEADKAVVGHEVRFWRHWFENAIGNDGFWKEMNHRHRLSAKTPPNHFISGWYDFMIDQLLADYRTLIGFGHKPYLTVGSWTHIANDLQAESMRETLIWMRAKLMGDASELREKPVRLHIGGIDEWREHDAYPPGPARMEEWHLQPGFGLSESPAPDSPPDTYRYDPADPTPNAGGAMFAFTGAGPVDNAAREARADVLCYTSESLAQPLTIIGQTRVMLFARAAVPYADFFLRLCDVSREGISINITDGLIRVTPQTPTEPDGNWRLEFTLHATAYCFRAGHRLRLQVSSGAHPRFSRNLGTDEPLGTATRMVANDVEIFHAPGRESRVALACYEV